MIKLHSLSLHDFFPWSATFHYECYARVFAVVSDFFLFIFFLSKQIYMNGAYRTECEHTQMINIILPSAV